VATAPLDATIREAAETMTRRRIGSLVLLGPDGAPAGIVTDRDIRDKVVALGRDSADPAAAVMSSPVITADARDYAFEALLVMLRHDVHHLPVTDGGALRGIITNHDLMVLQGTSPLSVVQEVEHQRDAAGLAQSARRVAQVVGLLVKEGARASHVARVVTEISDRVVRRALDIAGREAGPPPCAWAWLALGSEGRGEQVFRTDQDNALVLEDLADPQAAETAGAWAARLAGRAVEILVACGYPRCADGLMASNPRWRQPLSAWQRDFADFVRAPDAPGGLGRMIFLDFRVVAGDTLLGERLRDHLVARVAERPGFLLHLAGQVAANRPPLGFFGALVVEKSGEHKDQLNLKERGIVPLVDLVRFFALEKGVRETGTVERIEALRAGHPLVREYADELLQAFEFLLLLRIHSQFRRSAAGEEPGSFIDPAQLTPLERRTAKDAFQVISRVQGEVAGRLPPSIY
jgi:CBS domain-containing protein